MDTENHDIAAKVKMEGPCTAEVYDAKHGRYEAFKPPIANVSANLGRAAPFSVKG